MTKSVIVATFIGRMEKADLEGLRALLDPDDRHQDAFMEPLNAEALLGFVKSLHEAFPYWESNFNPYIDHD